MGISINSPQSDCQSLPSSACGVLMCDQAQSLLGILYFPFFLYVTCAPNGDGFYCIPKVVAKDAVTKAAFDDFLAHQAVITQGEQWFGKDNEPRTTAGAAGAAVTVAANVTVGTTPGGVTFTREDDSDSDSDDDDDGRGRGRFPEQSLGSPV